MLRAVGPHILSENTECEHYRMLFSRLNNGAHYGQDKKTLQMLTSTGCSQRFKMLCQYLESMPEAPVHCSLFKAFYEICFLPTHSAAQDSKLMDSAATKLRCKGTGSLTTEEARRTDAVIVLLKLLPKAHSDLLTYVLQFCWTTAMDPSGSNCNNSCTLRELAQFFGNAVCAPRLEATSGVEKEDHFAFVKSWGITDGWVLRSRSEEAEKEARALLHGVSVDLLHWLLSYWPKLYCWNRVCEGQFPTTQRAGGSLPTSPQDSRRRGTERSARVSELTTDLARSVRISLNSSSFDTGEPRVKAMPLCLHDTMRH